MHFELMQFWQIYYKSVTLVLLLWKDQLSFSISRQKRNERKIHPVMVLMADHKEKEKTAFSVLWAGFASKVSVKVFFLYTLQGFIFNFGCYEIDSFVFFLFDFIYSGIIIMYLVNLLYMSKTVTGLFINLKIFAKTDLWTDANGSYKNNISLNTYDHI